MIQNLLEILTGRGHTGDTIQVAFTVGEKETRDDSLFTIAIVAE